MGFSTKDEGKTASLLRLPMKARAGGRVGTVGHPAIAGYLIAAIFLPGYLQILDFYFFSVPWMQFPQLCPGNPWVDLSGNPVQMLDGVLDNI